MINKYKPYACLYCYNDKYTDTRPAYLGYFNLYFRIIKSLSLTLFQNTLVIHSGNSLPVCTVHSVTNHYSGLKRGGVVVGAYCGTLYLLFTGFFFVTAPPAADRKLYGVTNHWCAGQLSTGLRSCLGLPPLPILYTLDRRTLPPPPPSPHPRHGAYFRPWR